MRRLGLCLLTFLLYAAGSCSRETGLPDPPLRTLVPCVADAAADDPLACPEPEPAEAEPADGGMAEADAG
ncbi:MAG: hypothetical protein JNM83_05000 [Myxococcales bacterium]|nr:hypothetical protein [Myxococcales bacterium]